MTRPDGQRIEVRDRRELPFFQVRLDAVKAIRQARSARGGCVRSASTRCCASSPTSNATRESTASSGSATTTLARRGQVEQHARSSCCSTRSRGPEWSGTSASTIPVAAQRSACCTCPSTTARGRRSPSAMADHLAARRDGGHLLRDLGLIVVLLELCAEQRAERGGLSAEVTRSEIATRAGLTRRPHR